MWKRFTGITYVVIALFLVTAACSSAPTIEEVADHDETVEEVADHDETVSEADRVLEVELTEFDIVADSFAFSPGETVEFVITNSGVVEHEFRLSNMDRVEEHLEGGHDDHADDEMTDEEMAAMPPADEEAADHDDDEAEHTDEAPDAYLVLAAGESGTMVFTFPDNDHDYTMAVCLIPGHYEAGMTTDLSA